MELTSLNLIASTGDGGDDLGVLEEDAGGDRTRDDVQRSQSVWTLKLSHLQTTTVRLLKLLTVLLSS